MGKINLKGNGTESEPYLISSQLDLKSFAKDVNDGNSYEGKFIKLTNNIKFTRNEIDQYLYNNWTPIGNKVHTFQGNFDGDGYTISGLYFNNPSQNYVGLFGYSKGIIKNVGIVNSYFNGNWRIGSVCGCNDSTITNCYNTGIIRGYGEVGSICGESIGTITNCHNTGEVSGRKYIGSICGYNFSTIEKCYNTGIVNGVNKSEDIGGICGENGEESIIINCYNTGKISGGENSWYIGGICGNNTGGIGNCYNTGEISGSQYIGDICGQSYNYSAIITNCYYLSNSDNGHDAKTKDQFNNGCVAYLLSQGKNGGVWGQDLSKDNLPMLNGYKVYYDEINHKYVNSDIEHIIYEEPNKDSNGVYLISNAENLYWFAKYVNEGNYTANAILTKSIVVNKEVFIDGKLKPVRTSFEWIPIGDDYDSGFRGIFNGNRHTISGLYFNNSNRYYVGLFGYNQGTIQNVGVVDSYFKGHDFVGGICGYNDGTITDCYNTSSINGLANIGGVCGHNYRTLANCHNTGEINGSKNVGGVCGHNVNSVITHCYNVGIVNGSHNVSGISGYNFSDTIINCFNTGKINGLRYVGGVCGYNELGKITTCNNAGVINGKTSEYIDGICGYNCGDIKNCNNTGKVNVGEKSENVENKNKDNSNETTLNCNNSLEVIDIENDIKTEEQFSSDTCELLPESSGLLDSAIAYARYENKNIPFDIINKLVKAYITGAMAYNIFNTGFSFIINNKYFKSSPYFCKECPFKSKILNLDYCLAKHSHVNKEDVIPTECQDAFFECEHLGGTWEITNPNTMDLELVL